MRPKTVSIESDGAPQTLPSDPSPFVWTTAGHELDVTIEAGTTFMDDNSQFAIVSNELTVPEGIYRVDVEMVLTNTNAAARQAVVAVTSDGGTTVYREGPSLDLPGSSDSVYVMSALCHVTGVANTIGIRAVQNEAGTDIQVADNQPVATVTKIGNVYET